MINPLVEVFLDYYPENLMSKLIAGAVKRLTSMAFVALYDMARMLNV